MIKSKDVQRLTGLSADQLREWTSRRGLIQPDVRPSGPGTLALFSWQTVLILRIAIQFRDNFHMELQAHKSLFSALSERLRGMPFPALWGHRVVLYASGRWELQQSSALSPQSEDFLQVCLDSHLEVLTQTFDPPEPSRQLPLFRAVSVR